MTRYCAALLTIVALGWPPGVLEAQPQRPTGLVFADPAAYEAIPLATPPPAGTLPMSADYSSLFPRPGDQGYQGSCVGWAVAYALKSFQERQERAWAYSPDRVFSPAYIYNQIRRGNCLGGSRVLDAFGVLLREGVAPLSAFPYDPDDCSRLPDAVARQAAEPFRIATWRRVNSANLHEVKSQIAAGYPVIIAMRIDEQFENLRGNAVYRGPSGQTSGHAMVVTGYDDARRAFRVINSWGTEWGDDGFGWIAYGAFQRAVEEAYTVHDIRENPPPPTPDPAPDPTPTPPPRPDARPVIASVQMPQIQHNQFRDGYYWMDIRVPGVLQQARGRPAQIVVRFAFHDQTPLWAHPDEQYFRDTNGKVTTGTQRFTVPADWYDLGQLHMTIPYYAFNLQPTNGTTTYHLVLWAEAFVDNRPVAVSDWSVPFTVRW